MLYTQVVLPNTTWTVESNESFDECMLSWNAPRPLQGKYQFFIRFKFIDGWSEWVAYAEWGHGSQRSFASVCKCIGIKNEIDVLRLTQECTTALQVMVKTVDITTAHPIKLFVSLSKKRELALVEETLFSAELSVKGISQIALKHPHSRRICSSVSSSAVIAFLMQTTVDPIQFAQNAYDHDSEIYGNWVLNIAQAYTFLGKTWECWVEKLTHFNTIIATLQSDIPVVVSVKGPLPGSASPYAEGHLMVVCGYAHKAREVICMDPAFPEHHQTRVAYPLAEFLQAWNASGNLAYLFKKAR